jgi:hypothetical protein
VRNTTQISNVRIKLLKIILQWLSMRDFIPVTRTKEIMGHTLRSSVLESVEGAQQKNFQE